MPRQTNTRHPIWQRNQTGCYCLFAVVAVCTICSNAEDVVIATHTLAYIVSKSNKAGEMRHEVTSFIHGWKDAGGGVEMEGDNIAVLELSFDKSYEMTEKGEIIDGKTITLLRYAAMRLLNKQDK
jgi:hypothetical protein